jgi:hypothetical protein
MFHGWMGGRAKLEDSENVKEFERGWVKPRLVNDLALADCDGIAIIRWRLSLQSTFKSPKTNRA